MRPVIGICDDEPLVLQSLKHKIEDCLEKNGWVAEVLIFQSGIDLLERIPELEIIFLDIDMPDLDGIETGKQILNINKNCKIIIESGRMDKFKETFKINAFRFITKPFDMGEIEEALQAIWGLNLGMQKIEVYENRIPYSIYYRDISYILSYGSFTEFFVGSKRFRKDISLSKLEEILDKNLFYRPNRQYMINMMHITDVKNEVIKLKNQNIRISRRKQKDFEMAFMNFDLKYGGNI